MVAIGACVMEGLFVKVEWKFFYWIMAILYSNSSLVFYSLFRIYTIALLTPLCD
jgi:hypothetical protein